MINRGKFNVLGVNISALDYEAALEAITEAAEAHVPLGVSALAVHGVMTGAQDPVHRQRLNSLAMLVPDGQPVRWALKWLHGVSLPDRVYGPELMLRTCQRAAEMGLPIYLYGSTQNTLAPLTENLQRQFPDLKIAGKAPSKFRRLNEVEKAEVVEEIRASGARVVFVGLGCPRQEVWTYEYVDQLEVPVIAVGAAFDFHAGNLAQAPAWMQRLGLEWVFRLTKEPKRLWKRYLLLNPEYLARTAFQKLGTETNSGTDASEVIREENYG